MQLSWLRKKFNIENANEYFFSLSLYYAMEKVVRFVSSFSSLNAVHLPCWLLYYKQIEEMESTREFINHLNPFTPESGQFQISPAASPEI